jgi:hypothetical protein
MGEGSATVQDRSLSLDSHPVSSNAERMLVAGGMVTDRGPSTAAHVDSKRDLDSEHRDGARCVSVPGFAD